MGRKILTGLVTLVLVGGGIGWKVGVQQAISYNDKIITLDENVLNEVTKLDEQLESESANAADLEKQRLQIVDAIKNNLAVLEKTKFLITDFGFHDTEIEMFGLYKEWAEKDYPEIIKIYAKSDFTDADGANLDKINQSMIDREKVILKKVTDAQEKFAKTYGFKLEYEPTTIKK